MSATPGNEAEPGPNGLAAVEFDQLLREVLDRMHGLVDEKTRLRLLLDAVVSMAGDLTLGGVLDRIVEAASRLAGARYAALGVLGVGEERRLSSFVHHGMTDEQVRLIGDLPSGHGLLGHLIDEPRPIRLRDLQTHDISSGFPPRHPPMHSFLGVPVRIGDRVFGNLYLTEKIDGGDFTAEDEEIVVALAAAAGVVIENARLYEETIRARADHQRLAVLEDRDRIGRDLHDVVIQRLFALGLGLQDIVRRLADREAEAALLNQAIDDVDATIMDIRRSIFALGSADGGGDIQVEITRLVDRAAATLKVRPTLRFDGPVRSLIDADLAPTVLAVLSEALANVSKHAAATAVDVRLQATDAISLIVADNGRGMRGDIAESGLANMRARAAQRAGTLDIESAPGAGTTVRWSVPIPAPADPS